MTNKQCDISIIIPCHNLEQYIEKCLKSIYSLNFCGHTYEIICVCDSCTDNTEKIIKDFSYNHNFPIKIITVNFERAGKSRNAGLDASCGKYIWFIDGDDWIIEPACLYLSFNAFDNWDCSAVHFKFTTGNLYDGRFYNNTAWSYIFRRESLKDLRFGNTKVHEDDIFITEFLRRVVSQEIPKVYFLDKTVYFYNYPREDSLIYKFLKGEIRDDE